MLQNLIDIIAAPSAVFARVKEKPAVLFPLLLVLIAIASVQVGYILLTDRGFLIDQQLEQAEVMLGNMPDEQREQTETQMRNMSTTTLVAQTAISTMLLTFVIMALYALYLRIVSKFSFVEFGWKAWLALYSWTSVPLVFSAIASWVVLLSSSNGQVPMLQPNPLSFSNLLGLGPIGGPLTYLGPLYLWHFVLLVLGYQHWTKKSLLASALLSLAPYLLIFGGWAYIAS